MRIAFNRNLLIVIGSLAALGAGASLYANVRQKGKDRKAAAILKEVRKLISPASSGLQAETAFSLDYKEQVLSRISGKVIVLSTSMATRKATSIHNAFAGWWQGGDDEDAIYGVFRSLKDKVQVSQVATAYYDRYRVNLIDKLYDKLTESEVKIILDIIKKLPAYRKSTNA